jgi:hypothetical protein
MHKTLTELESLQFPLVSEMHLAVNGKQPLLLTTLYDSLNSTIIVNKHSLPLNFALQDIHFVYNYINTKDNVTS